MSTYMQGRLEMGSTPAKDANVADSGVALCSQRVSINFDGTLVQNATLKLPVGSTIVDVMLDVKTVYNSATSAIFSLGTSSGNTTYASGVSAKTAGRTRPTFTAAQVAAISAITSATVVATVTSVGQPSAGSADVIVIYQPAA